MPTPEQVYIISMSTLASLAFMSSFIISKSIIPFGVSVSYLIVGTYICVNPNADTETKHVIPEAVEKASEDINNVCSSESLLPLPEHSFGEGEALFLLGGLFI